MSGRYESHYVRAVDPDRPRGVWIRRTTHERPGHEPTASLWCTHFDARNGRPYAVKETHPAPELHGDHRSGSARGEGRSATWELDLEPLDAPLRHLPAGWMYRAPLPRTKLESPLPHARFRGSVRTGDHAAEDLDGWLGMTGHNWGSEHAAAWIWLHGTAFPGAPRAWLDLSVGRVRVGPVLTPWIANGALTTPEGERIRLGGPRPARVRATPAGCRVELPQATVEAASPPEQTVAWRYADPAGAEHHSLNCSIAALTITTPGATLTTPHGGAYELGTTDTDHGIPVEPFSDG